MIRRLTSNRKYWLISCTTCTFEDRGFMELPYDDLLAFVEIQATSHCAQTGHDTQFSIEIQFKMTVKALEKESA